MDLPKSTSMWFLILFQVFFITFKSVDTILRCSHLNESYKVVLTFETVDGGDPRSHARSSEQYFHVVSYTFPGVSKFEVCG